MNDKIVLRQSSIIINDYEIGDCSNLESFFMMWDPITHTQYLKAALYDEEKRQLYLPRGIDTWYLEKQFKCKSIVDKKHDKFDTKQSDTMISTLPRDDRQKEALRFILGQGEYEWTNTYSQKLIACPTGFGKTYIAIAGLAFLNLKSIIITSAIDWLKQWKLRITEYTDIKTSEIYHISGSGSIFRILNNPGLVDKYKVFLISHSTIKSYGEKYGWDQVAIFFKALNIGIKIYDEAHLNFDNMFYIDAFSNTYLTWYLTATPARSDKDQNALYRLYFKNVPKIDMFDEDIDPHTNYVAMMYNSHPRIKDINGCKNMYGLDRNKYVKYLVNQDTFYDVLTIIMHHIRTETWGKILMYVETNEAILIIHDWIEENFPEFKGRVGIFTSISDKTSKREQLDKRIILSTIKSAGAALDIAGLQETIVLAAPFKSEVITRQTLGRTRNTDTTYIELVDTGFYYTRKYYLDKEPILQKYASTCSVQKLDDNFISKKLNEIEEYNKRPRAVTFENES